MQRINRSAYRAYSFIHKGHQVINHVAEHLPEAVNNARHDIEYKLVEEYLKLYQKWLNKRITLLEPDAGSSSVKFSIIPVRNQQIQRSALDEEDGRLLREYKMAHKAISVILHSQGSAMIPADEIEAAMKLIMKIKKPLLNNHLAEKLHDMACIYIKEYPHIKAVTHEVMHIVQNESRFK